MIISIEDWIFDVDMAATMEYSAREAAEHCDCGYCRNFYSAVDEAYPQLRPFLAQFGLDIEAPDELLPYDIDKQLYYDGFYAVSGKILCTGKNPIRIGNSRIEPDLFNDLYFNTGCPQPYFFLNMGNVILPWVLDEPMEDVISPANEPSFLKKMWNRLLGRTSEGISS